MWIWIWIWMGNFISTASLKKRAPCVTDIHHFANVPDAALCYLLTYLLTYCSCCVQLLNDVALRVDYTFHSYRTLFAIWDHTVLPATRHK